MTVKNRCYEALNELACSQLSVLPIGNHRRHLKDAGAIIELEIRSDTCLRFRDEPDDESPYADIVEYRVDHAKKEAEPVYQWIASPINKTGEKQGNVKKLERIIKWLRGESLPLIAA